MPQEVQKAQGPIRFVLSLVSLLWQYPSETPFSPTCRKLDTPSPHDKIARMDATLQTPPPLPEIRRIVREVCARHPVARADLFGSVARGNAGPGSDVDVLVEFLPGAEVGLFEMGALREELAEALGCPVDVVSRRAVKRSTNPFRRRAMLTATLNAYVR